MNKLKLNQLNKQQVADREMKVIEGGTDMAVPCWGVSNNRAWYNYKLETSSCSVFCDYGTTNSDRPCGSDTWDF